MSKTLFCDIEACENEICWRIEELFVDVCNSHLVSALHEKEEGQWLFTLFDISDYKSRQCLDCCVDTFDIQEDYMVTYDIWYTVNPEYKGMLCIGCLEIRLGRELTRGDFIHCPINAKDYEKSPRLIDRLGHRYDEWMQLKHYGHDIPFDSYQLGDFANYEH